VIILDYRILNISYKLFRLLRQPKEFEWCSLRQEGIITDADDGYNEWRLEQYVAELSGDMEEEES